MKRLDLSFAVLRIPVDIAMIVLAGLTAYWIRVSDLVAEYRPVMFSITPGELVRALLAVSSIWVVIFAFNRLYAIRARGLRDESRQVVYAASTAMMFVFTIIFFSRQLFESRFIVLVAWALAIVYLVVARALIQIVYRRLLAHGYGQRRAIFIGPKADAELLMKAFKQHPSLGFRVLGSRTHFDSEAQSWILRKHNRGGIDNIFLTNPDASRAEALKLVQFCEEHHITFLYSADLLEASTSRLKSHTYAGIPLFEVQRTPLDGWGRIYKRSFDIVASILLIVLSSPLQLFVAIVLLLERQGGIFFSKLPNGKPVLRVGEGGKPFQFYKFRSMVKDAHKLRFDKKFIEKHGNEREGTPLFKLEKDPRVTAFGRFIRRTSIDEIPQFYHVLMGKMSLVGPRPHFPEEVDQYESSHRKVLTVKPGITGMAQISGRADLHFEEEVRLDTYYIENWTPWLDLYILAKTPWAVIVSRGAK